MTETPVRGDRDAVVAACEEMGEAAVLSDLERSGSKFNARAEAHIAWEWIYEQRINREKATGEAIRNTARQTMYVAVGTFFVALFTAGLFLFEYFSRR